MRQIEFFITPEGRVMVQDQGKGFYEFTPKERELCLYIKDIISTQFPEAFDAICEIYKKSQLNKPHFDYLVTHRFIRCNFGKFDGLTFDIDDGVMHIEEVACPIRCECPFREIICKPKPFGLSKREAEVARLSCSGKSYDEISNMLNITHSTIKNVLQNIKKKMKLKSSMDIAKFLVTTIGKSRYLYMLSQEFCMGGGREAISLPCSRLKAIELRDWTRKVFDGVNIYHDIQIRELRTNNN